VELPAKAGARSHECAGNNLFVLLTILLDSNENFQAMFIHPTNDYDFLLQMDTSMLPTESAWAGRRRAELDSLPFDVTEGWDGQIMFTKGVGDGQGLMDVEFEAHAERFVASPKKLQEESGDGDDGMEGSDGSMSDGGYEEEDGGEGDTADEGLVNEDEETPATTGAARRYPHGGERR
jgi:hypothetical protein